MKKIKIIASALIAMTMLAGCKADEKKDAKESKTKESSVEVKKDEKEEKEKYEWNGHVYQVDAVTGATVEEKTNNEKTEMDTAEKEAKMYWSGRPKLGTIKGDYYHNEVVFNEGYTAVVDVVTTDDKISLVEFDEIGPGDYYDGDWAGMNKRLSGYAFFQASKGRTDKTLVTLVNTMTFLENQMIEENRLSGEFQTAKGSSNSANEGFIPAVNELEDAIKEPSKEMYYSITSDFGDGLFGRLVVIRDKESKKIKDFRYDEYFADTKEDIADKDLQKYYRQSKYYSKDYSKESGEDFRKQADELKEEVLAQNKLEGLSPEATFMTNYNKLASEMTKLLSE